MSNTFLSLSVLITILQAVFRIRIRIRPDPKLFGLEDPDPDPKLLISDPAPDLDPDPPLFHTKLKNLFINVL